MIQWIKELFCKHEWMTSTRRAYSVRECVKCGRREDMIYAKGGKVYRKWKKLNSSIDNAAKE